MNRDKLRASAELGLTSSQAIRNSDVIALLDALDDAEKLNKKLKNDSIAKTLCISYLSSGVAKLWDSVTSGMHDARSLVGDTTLDMQEALMDIEIDARGVKALTQKGGQPEEKQK